MRLALPTLGRARRVLYLTVASALLPAATALGACSSEGSSSPGSLDAGSDGRPPEDAQIVIPDAGPYDGAVAPTTPPSCQKYCELVSTSCRGDHEQYASEAGCLRACKALTPGDAKDRTGNTLACRQYHAGSPAKTDPAQFCAVAGLFGDGVCGDRCTAFCELTARACDGDAGGARPYADLPACATACANYIYAGLLDGGGPTVGGPETGNTLDCRMYHAARAIEDAALHCPDTAEQSVNCK